MSDDMLPVIWALIIGLSVALYVVLDGLDLGIGILFPFLKDEAERDLAMNSVAPYWDGNETWLVMGGVGLWVAFPKAYAIILPAVYLPIIVMLLALIFRGVAFEFRWVAKPTHHHWDLSFTAGSIVATFSQGVVLGALLQEIRVQDGQFAGGALDWLSPFSLMCGAALVAGYGLLGATWLMMKTGGAVADHARRLGEPLLFAMLAFVAVVSLWTPLQIDRIAQRWFSLPNLYLLAPIPIATAILAWLCWRGMRRHRDVMPFACAAGMFLLAYLGLVISNAPYLVPPSLTIWQAAADPSSQFFFLVGAVVLLPMVLGYTVFVFWLFRGRLQPGEGYH
ncbi:cytochrome d ubiquinol oxidase subunit II [Herbaspirillum sp. GCM10030257]|uniref:cytochrome d ubiquinol oxidase subunit II n=1 Tax=Herbaspirillum sp. GCM10030257 TaxID=3273393 RepID=UPI00361189E0